MNCERCNKPNTYSEPVMIFNAVRMGFVEYSFAACYPCGRAVQEETTEFLRLLSPLSCRIEMIRVSIEGGCTGKDNLDLFRTLLEEYDRKVFQFVDELKRKIAQHPKTATQPEEKPA